jgi:UDP-N-acetyl-D-galactosamine dehydrogenase
LRNSKVMDLVHELESYGATIFIHDPVADPVEAQHEYGVSLTPWDALPRAAAIVAAVGHAAYREMGLEAIAAKCEPGGVLVDVKSAFDPAAVAALGLRTWRL